MNNTRMEIYMEALKYDVEHLSENIKRQLSLLGVNVDGDDLHQLPLYCLNINTYLGGGSAKGEDKNDLLLVIRYLVNRILYEGNFDNDYTIALVSMLKSEATVWDIAKKELYQYVMWTDDPYGAAIYYLHVDDNDDYMLNVIIASNKAKLYSRIIRYSYAKKNMEDDYQRYQLVLGSIITHLCYVGYLSDFINYMNDANTKFSHGHRKFFVPIDELLNMVPREYDFMKLGVVI